MKSLDELKMKYKELEPSIKEATHLKGQALTNWVKEHPDETSKILMLYLESMVTSFLTPLKEPFDSSKQTEDKKP